MSHIRANKKHIDTERSVKEVKYSRQVSQSFSLSVLSGLVYHYNLITLKNRYSLPFIGLNSVLKNLAD